MSSFDCPGRINLSNLAIISSFALSVNGAFILFLISINAFQITGSMSSGKINESDAPVFTGALFIGNGDSGFNKRDSGFSRASMVQVSDSHGASMVLSASFM